MNLQSPRSKVDYSNKTKEELLREIELLLAKQENMPSSFPGLAVINKFEKLLTNSEERYRILNENTQEAIAIHQDGTLREVNKAFCDLFAIGEKDWIGKKTEEINNAFLQEIFKVAAPQQGPTPAELQTVCADGTSIYCEINSKTIPYKNGIASVVCIRDISERKRNEENNKIAHKKLLASEERYKMLFSKANDAIFIMDNETFIDCNEKTLEMFACKRSEIIGHPPYEFSPMTQPDGQNSTEKAIKKIKLALLGIPQQFFWRHQKKTKQEFEAQVSLNALEIGGKTFLQAIVRDISGAKEIEYKLKENEEKFRMLAENANDIVFRLTLTPEFQIDYISPAVETITQYAADSFYKNPYLVYEIIHPEDQPITAETVKAIKAKTKINRINTAPNVLRWVKKNKEVIWVETTNKAIKNTKGDIIAIEGISRDITDRKKMEIQLIDSRENYKVLVDNSPDAIFIFNKEKIIFANPKGLELLGISRLTAKEKRSIYDLILPEFHDTERKRMLRATKGESLPFVEYKLITGAGKIVEIEAKTLPVVFKGEYALQLVVHDISQRKMLEQEQRRASIAEESNKALQNEISERKKAEQRLLDNQKFTRNIINSSLDMISASDRSGRITQFNPAALKVFGYDPAEIIGKNVSILFATKKEYRRINKILIEQGSFSGQILNKRKSGEFFNTYLSASHLYNEKGEQIGGMGVSRDITHQIKAEKAIKESEERYRDLFENASDLIQSVDLNGTIIYVNDAWKNTLGFKDKEIIGKNIFNFIHPSSREHCSKVFAQIKKGKNQDKVELVFVTKTNKQVICEGNFSCSFEKGKPVSTRGILRNITERKRSEEEIEKQSAKLKAIFESSSHILWSTNKKNELVSFNTNYAKQVKNEYGIKVFVGQRVDQGKMVSTKEYNQFWKKKYQSAFSGISEQFETSFKDKKGNVIWREVFLNPIYAPDGSVVEVSGIAHDITEKKLALEKIISQSALIKAIFDSGSNLIYSIDKNFQLLTYNKAFANFIKASYHAQVVQNINTFDFVKRVFQKEEFDYFVYAHKQALKGQPQYYQNTVKSKNGEIMGWQEMYLSPLKLPNGKIEEVSYLAHDITDKMIAAQKVKQSLREKEVLLKEVHHRVKNNLQVISSILNLQSTYIKDKYTQDMFAELQNRIKSMSFIHESLYRTKDFSSVDFSEYVINLCNNLVHSYQIYSTKIKPIIKIEKVFLNLDLSIPCGLIINELVSNSFKYAFKKQEHGNVTVAIKQRPNKMIEMTISDNGPGLPSTIDFRNTESLGLQLVVTLVDQINGKIELNKSNGTKFIITFKNEKTKN